MRLYKFVIIFIILNTLYGCWQSDDGDEYISYNAVVVGAQMGCGDAYLIQFWNSSDDIPDNSTNDIFVAINLPEEYKVTNLRIEVDYRLPYDSELLNCTAQSQPYPEIFIEEVLYSD